MEIFLLVLVDELVQLVPDADIWAGLVQEVSISIVVLDHQDVHVPNVLVHVRDVNLRSLLVW